MMRRRIFLWMGLIVLFATIGLSRTGLARVTHQVQSGDARLADLRKGRRRPHALKAANQTAKSAHPNPIKPSITPSSKVKKVAKPVKSSPPGKEVYTVRKGDTLARIAKKTGVSVAELRDLNRLEGSFLKIGQKLVLHQRRDRDEVSTPAEYAKNEAIPELPDWRKRRMADSSMKRPGPTIERRAKER